MALVQTSFTSPTTLDVVYERRWGWKYVPFIRKDVRPQPYEKIVWYFNGGNTHMLPGSYATRAGTGLWGDNSPGSALGTNSPEHNQAYARAYSKFVGRLYGQASLLTAVAERQSTLDMVVKRLSQIHKGAKHLRKGQFRSFLKTFDLAPKPKHLHKRWSRPRDFASLWLEYWFGWAPTVGDIYNAVEFLGSEIPTHTVRAGAQVPYRTNYVQHGSYGTKATTSCLGTHTVWVQARAIVTNPTLFTMQGLGLANPFKTVWELIPFSWFADWFTNIGQVLGQLTDFLGLKVQDLVLSVKTEVTSTWVLEKARSIFGQAAPDTVWRSRDFIGFRRQVGGTLPTVKPILRLPNGLSITRGATLASLIVQLFAPKKAII